AYRTADPNLAGHQSAEAVVVHGNDITVLCSANPKGDGEHTWLIRLAADGAVAWQHHFSPDQGVGRALAALPDGGFAIAGEIQRSAMEYQAYLLRTDAAGNPVAGAAFGPRGVTGFTSLTVLDDGAPLAGGAVNGHGWLVQVDPRLDPAPDPKAGAKLRATWDAPLAEVDDVFGLVPLDGGFAMVARRERSTLRFGRTRAAAFQADRKVRWQVELPAEGRGEPAGLARLPGGGVALVGHHAASDHARSKIWVAKVTGADQVAWQRTLGSPEDECRGRAIAALPDGGVVVAGDALRDGKRGLRLARIGPDGAMIWEHALGDATGQDVARGIAPTADGGFVVVGSTSSKGAGKTNVWIVKLDSDGRRVWDRAFGTAG
ncbi:MAG TPA: hypothetical protein VK601_23385, partial [Kofleriaceae bacterium]|nr:hypothetical protein [Kofleriaceae bacterium]